MPVLKLDQVIAPKRRFPDPACRRLQPAGGAAAHHRLHAQPARRSPRSAVDAHASMAVRRVPGRGRRFARDARGSPISTARWEPLRSAGRRRRTIRRSCRSKHASSASRSRSCCVKPVDGQTYSDLVFAVRWGRRFFRDLRDAGLDGNYGLYLEKYPMRVLPATPPPGDPLRVPLDAEAEQICGALAGRIADGVAIWRAVRSGAHDAWIDAASAQPGQAGAQIVRLRVCAGVRRDPGPSLHPADRRLRPGDPNISNTVSRSRVEAANSPGRRPVSSRPARLALVRH